MANFGVLKHVIENVLNFYLYIKLKYSSIRLFKVQTSVLTLINSHKTYVLNCYSLFKYLMLDLKLLVTSHSSPKKLLIIYHMISTITVVYFKS